MSAFLLVIPWLAVRHAVPALAGGDGAARAAHTAFGKKEGAARIACDLLTVAVVMLPLALTVRAEGALLAAGAVLYAGGLVLEARATWDFCRPGPHGFADGGAPPRARGGAVVPRAVRGTLCGVHGARAPLPVGRLQPPCAAHSMRSAA